MQCRQRDAGSRRPRKSTEARQTWTNERRWGAGAPGYVIWGKGRDRQRVRAGLRSEWQPLAVQMVVACRVSCPPSFNHGAAQKAPEAHAFGQARSAIGRTGSTAGEGERSAGEDDTPATQMNKEKKKVKQRQKRFRLTCWRRAKAHPL